jgi:hypothetical protein
MSESHYQLDQLTDSMVPCVVTGGMVPVSDKLTDSVAHLAW